MDSKTIFVIGNLFEAREDYICHQTNCTSTRALGLAQDVFAKYPHANTYKDRTKTSLPFPGSVDILQGPKNIINLNAQVYPGRRSRFLDHPSDRQGYFASCLTKIAESTPMGSSFAFPHGIGCGLAGGDWKAYKAMIEKFAHHPNVGRVVVYSL